MTSETFLAGAASASEKRSRSLSIRKRFTETAPREKL